MANYVGYKASVTGGVTGTSTLMTKEACSLNANRSIASIVAAGKRFVDPAVAVVVYVGVDAATAVVSDAENYTFYYGGGRVEFKAGHYPAAGENVYVSGRYLPTAAVGEVRNVTLATTFDVKDVTTLDAAGDGWKKNKAVLREGQVTVSGFLDDAVLNYLDSEAIGDKYVFIEVVYANTFIWSAIAVMSSHSAAMAMDDFVTNERTLNTSGPIFYSAI